MPQPLINPENGGYEAHSLNEIEPKSSNGYIVYRVLSWKEICDRIAEEIEKASTDVINGNTFEKVREENKKKSFDSSIDRFYDLKLGYMELFEITLKKLKIGMYEVDKKTKRSELVDLTILAFRLFNQFFGFNVLQGAVDDDDVTDIFVISYNEIFIKKKGRNCPYDGKFESEFEYEKFLKNILRIDRKEFNSGTNKIVDAEIYGMRFNVVNSNVSTKGITCTIRKHHKGGVSFEDYLENKVMNPLVGEVLKTLIQGGTNGLICGITGCGKTTLLRALLDHSLSTLPDYPRVLTLEDTPELFLKHTHTVSMHTLTTGNSPELMVTLDDLNKVALRQMPDYIVVGEVRSVEAVSMCEAMSTGHSTFCTLHAGNPWDAFNRLMTKYQEKMTQMPPSVVERIVGPALDWILFIDNIPEIGRRITSLSEVHYDYQNHCIVIDPVMQYNFKKDAEGMDPNECFDFKKTLCEEIQDKMVRRRIRYKDLEKLNNDIHDRIKKQEEEEKK